MSYNLYVTCLERVLRPYFQSTGVELGREKKLQ